MSIWSIWIRSEDPIPESFFWYTMLSWKRTSFSEAFHEKNQLQKIYAKKSQETNFRRYLVFPLPHTYSMFYRRYYQKVFLISRAIWYHPHRPVKLLFILRLHAPPSETRWKIRLRLCFPDVSEIQSRIRFSSRCRLFLIASVATSNESFPTVSIMLTYLFYETGVLPRWRTYSAGWVYKSGFLE